MRARRLLYIAALAGAAAFYLFDTGYFSWLLLLIGLGFLPAQLLLSLPGLLAARITIRATPAEAGYGQPFELAVLPVARRPICSIKTTLMCENLYTGSHHKLKLRLPMGQAAIFDISEYGAACGAVRFTLRRARVLDLAGLIAFPLLCPGPVMVLARPPLPHPTPPLPDAALDQSALPDCGAGRPGPDAMREFTDIREYRAGDSPRDIHWKLTAKFDKLMVREGSFSHTASPQLCIDYFGRPEVVAKTLGRLQSLSAQLWAIERLHCIHWLNEDGSLTSRTVSGKAEYDAVLWELMEHALPAEGRSITGQLPQKAGPVLLIGPGTTQLYEDGKLREEVE